jgi:hypothetical protein
MSHAAVRLHSMTTRQATRPPPTSPRHSLSTSSPTPAWASMPPTTSHTRKTAHQLTVKPVFKPVFVFKFPGLTPNKCTQHLQQDAEQQDVYRNRNLPVAWSKYELGQEAATKLFEGRSGLTHLDLWRPVLHIFCDRNIEFSVAPYVAWAQDHRCAICILCFARLLLILTGSNAR